MCFLESLTHTTTVIDLLSYNPEIFERPRYIQRLSAPRERTNPFSFGAGEPNGGVPEEGMARLQSVWDFEYMGAAEYELGAAGYALARIAEGVTDGSYSQWSFFPKLGVSKRHELEKPKTPIALYVIGRTAHRSEIEEVITLLANKPGVEYDQLKEPAFVARSLRPSPQSPRRKTEGWLELMNGFLFFANEDMCTRALAAMDISDYTPSPR